MTERSAAYHDLASLIREMERFRENPQDFAPDEVEVMMTRALNAVSQLALLVMKAEELEDAVREGRQSSIPAAPRGAEPS